MNKQHPAKRAVQRRKFERDDLGGLIHTAFRKALDSQASSLVWNVIHLVEEPWGHYLNFVWENLKQPARTTPLSACLRDAVNAIAWGTHAGAALRCSLELVTEEEWEAIAGFMEACR